MSITIQDVRLAIADLVDEQSTGARIRIAAKLFKELERGELIHWRRADTNPPLDREALTLFKSAHQQAERAPFSKGSFYWLAGQRTDVAGAWWSYWPKGPEVES
jgi:hypothetical protein